MSMRLKEFHRPADQFEALALLRRSETRTLLLIPNPRPAPLADLNAEAVVDLSQLDLAYIKVTETAVSLGALTPLQDLVDSAPLAALANGLVPAAARLMAHFGMRHWATLQGALLASDHLPELSLALLALRAQLSVRQNDGALHFTPLADLGAHSIPPDGLMIETHWARTPGVRVGGALERVARAPLDAAIVAAAAVVELADGRCVSARLALAPAGVEPAVLMALAQKLVGQTLTPDNLRAVAAEVKAAVNPPADFRAGADYRRAMAEVLAYRALAAAWQHARG
jgi:aerobic carbon-monoxide dehydrogenase medium subunit